MTSEQEYGAPDQPGPICYHIDFGVMPSVMLGDIAKVESDLEALRSEVKDLRAWGEFWKQKFLSVKEGQADGS